MRCRKTEQNAQDLVLESTSGPPADVRSSEAGVRDLKHKVADTTLTLKERGGRAAVGRAVGRAVWGARLAVEGLLGLGLCSFHWVVVCK